MSKYILITIIGIYLSLAVCAQQPGRILSFGVGTDVKVTIDLPRVINKDRSTTIVFFALPNGNTTAQTMGKKLVAGDDWHYDIQHIRAQTRFVRKAWKKHQVVVAYLESTQKSWPQWKTLHSNYKELVQHITDTVISLIPARHKNVYLNGHSGGGRFIFSYLDGVDNIPSDIQRISFLDSNYGYDSSYTGKLITWLQHNKTACLNVFAYNDSVALYNGKPLVSATGGTWYRSHRMLEDLSSTFALKEVRNDSLIVYKSSDERIQFFLKINPDRKIFHTQQVELNGFIHSLFCGTRYDSRHYQYYTKRAYSKYIVQAPDL
ncbi:hypothetical protein D3H65_16365 [Paraflavitalea soli]|uniref:Alpha/beta hydrolase n=1 Tax=Paraflavitalea soli TaxID=2315862 RepID=A0A3B7MNV8_9BACT|nr:hypothetical protein [Paraflavitalea soli]AXY75457.1 hypothetical protein D3H65_16365 [Paraflavitalea soli]